MRTPILLVLVGILAFLALDSAERPYQSFDGPIITHYDGWKVMLFGMSLPAEAFILGLMVVVLLAFPRHGRAARTGHTPAPPPAADVETLREVNQMLDRMEHRIESLETILLDREARVKGTAEHD